MTPPSRAARLFGELPGTYWTICAGMFVNRLGGFVVPFLALYLTKDRGLGIAETGLIVSLFGLGSMTAGVVGGVLADRVGRRATMLVGLFGGGAVMMALGFAEHPVAIAVNVLVLGLVSDVYRPAVQAMVADLVPPEKRFMAYGHLYWAFNLGFSVALILGGLLAQEGYFWLFVADAATSVLYGVIILRGVPETRPPRQAGPVAGDRSGLVEVFSDGVFMAFASLSFLLAVVFFQHTTALPLDMASHGLSERTYGLVIAVNGILIVVLQPFANRVLGRFRRASVMACAALITGVGFGMYAHVGPLAWYAAGVVVWTLGEIAIAPGGSSIVADLAPSHLRGRYQGIFIMSWGLAGFVGPSVGALVLEGSGARALWVGCFALGAVVAVGHLAIAGARRRRIGQAAAPAERPSGQLDDVTA